jgi:hypothetical protein
MKRCRPGGGRSSPRISPRSLSDIDPSTTANDPHPPASFSARKNPQCIPANTAPIFSGLRPCIWLRLLCLVTKAMSDRLLARIIIHDGSLRNPAVALRDGHAERRGLAPSSATVPVTLSFKQGQAPKRRAPVPNSRSRMRAASLPAEGLSQQRIRDCSRSAYE